MFMLNGFDIPPTEWQDIISGLNSDVTRAEKNDLVQTKIDSAQKST
jgi:hypothetical protein